MQNPNRTFSSEYMHWVKTQTQTATYNLANSGLKSYPLSELPVDFATLALSGPGAYGYPPLKAAIAANYKVAEDCVVNTLGTSMANYLAMAATLEPGDQVLMEFPSYSLIWETAEFLGASIKFVARDLDAIADAITPQTRLIVLTNLHNPTCALLPQETLKSIGDLASKVGARVLVDEVYLDLLHESVPANAFHLGPQFISTSSLTKVYGLSGLRCGWVLAEPALTQKMLLLNDFLAVNNPHITDQISCVAFRQLPQIAAWSDAILKANRKTAFEILAGCPHVSLDPIAIGTVLFPKLDIPVEPFCEMLRGRYDTVVTPGRFFGVPEHVRLGLGGEASIVREGFTRLREALTLN